MAHSGAARAAVENMMRTLSIEWARFNVKLCAVAAGQFDTEVLRTKYPQGGRRERRPHGAARNGSARPRRWPG